MAVSGDDNVTSNRAVRQMEDRIRELERHLGQKTLEVESLKGEAPMAPCKLPNLDKSRSKKWTRLAQSQPKDGFPISRSCFPQPSRAAAEGRRRDPGRLPIEPARLPDGKREAASPLS